MPFLFALSCGVAKDEAMQEPTSSLTKSRSEFFPPPIRILVGRTREVALVRTAMDRVIAGAGGTVLIAGEPGIGKTRLAEEVCTCAERREVLVLRAASCETVGSPPYYLWAQLLRSYVAETDPGRLKTLFGTGAALIAEIASEVRDVLPGVGAPTPLENGDSARFRLHDAVARFLRRCSEETPMVLVFDDLHWADDASLDLLGFAAHELQNSRLLIVAAYRDAETRRRSRLQETIDSLERQQRCTLIQLAAFGEHEVGRLFELETGTKGTSAEIHWLYGETEGNPFFVIELLRRRPPNTRSSENRNGFETGKVPERVRALVAHTARQLSAPCVDLLVAAAILGRTFSTELLGLLVSDTTKGQLMGALGEAVAAGFVQTMDGKLEQYQFVHSLVQQKLVGDLALPELVARHAKTVLALERHYGDMAAEHAAEIAAHCSESSSLLGSQKVAHYSLLAGRQAETLYSWSAAVGHYRRGLEAREGSELDDEKAGLLAGMARSTAAATLIDRETARTVFGMLESAFSYYEATGQTVQAAECATVTIDHRDRRGTGNPLVNRALMFVEPNSTNEARLLWRHAYAELHKTHTVEESVADCRRGIEIAVRLGDRGVEARCRTALAEILTGAHRHEEAAPELDRALATAKDVSDALSEFVCHWRSANLSMMLGEATLARYHSEEAASITMRLPNWASTAYVLLVNVLTAIGDLEAARTNALRLIDLELDDSWFKAVSVGLLARVEVRAGNLQRATDLLDQMIWALQAFVEDPQYNQTPTYLPVEIIYMTGAKRHLDYIRRIVTDPPVIAGGMGAGFLFHRVYAESLLALIDNDETSAAKCYEDLVQRPHDTENGIDTFRMLALVARTAGMIDRASAHFEQCIDFSRRAGFLPELAYACSDYASLLIDCTSTAAAFERAAALLNEGVAVGRKLSMRSVVRQFGATRSRLASMRRADRRSNLSPRETEVLRLVAKGFTNKDIGKLLYISPKTVSAHLCNIYEKIGCANRAEATAIAIRMKLAEPQ